MEIPAQTARLQSTMRAGCRVPAGVLAPVITFIDRYFTGDLRNIKLDQSAVSKEINGSCEAW